MKKPDYKCSIRQTGCTGTRCVCCRYIMNAETEKKQCSDPQWFQCGSRSRVFMTKIKKVYSGKKFMFFISKIAYYLSLGLNKECPSYRRSLQLSKKNIQHFETLNFLTFLLLWVIFALLDPDPQPCQKARKSCFVPC